VYRFAAEFKNGSFKDIRPPLIIVTSNYTPEQLFPDPNVHLPIRDRFQFIEKNVVYKRPRETDLFKEVEYIGVHLPEKEQVIIPDPQVHRQLVTDGIEVISLLDDSEDDEVLCQQSEESSQDVDIDLSEFI